MKAELFYPRVIEVAARPAEERHRSFSELHSEVVAEYVAAVQAITAEQAHRPVGVGADQRTLAQVVGHIAAWEQFALQAVGDILAGVSHPPMVTSIEGYVDARGRRLDLGNIDAFNAYQAEQQASWSWEQIQELAAHTATTLHWLFAQPFMLRCLEGTQPFRKRLHSGDVIRNIKMGWNLWLTVLEHEAVEHAAELATDSSPP
jgi:hypothetical protein